MLSGLRFGTQLRHFNLYWLPYELLAVSVSSNSKTDDSKSLAPIGRLRVLSL